MADFADLVRYVSEDDIKETFIARAEAADLPITTWLEGGASKALFDIIFYLIWYFTKIVAQAIRGQFLEFASDPGDDGDGAEPAPGFLSVHGQGTYYTTRGERTAATGFLTLTNGGAVQHVLTPEGHTFQHEETFKQYRNSPDVDIYSTDGTLVLNPGDVVTIPIRAEELGTDSNAAAGKITVVVDGLIGVTCTNAEAVLGADREPRATYIGRCRMQAASTSPNGPGDAYRYIATSAFRDGTFGEDLTGTKERVNINRVQVSTDSVTGEVDVYFAAPSGAADPSDVTIVDTLIQQYAVPDGVTYTGSNAAEQTVNIVYTARARSGPGLTTSIIEDAAEERLEELFPEIPIGGWDSSGGTGYLFLSELITAINGANDAVYRVTLSSPAADVAIPTGTVVKLGTVTATVVLT